MKNVFVIVVGCLTVIAALLVVRRALDQRAEGSAWRFLRTTEHPEGEFHPDAVAALPEPARRYFCYMIDTGTPLCASVELEMSGQLGLGTKSDPRYRTMNASEILNPPFGLVWRLDCSLIQGSDASLPDESWTRFWLASLIPVARVSNHDHHRAAFGRVIVEAAVWVPASLLPGDHVRWEPLGKDSARAIVTFGRFVQAVDIFADAHGAPRSVVIQRWSNQNAGKRYRLQPFGGEFSGFKRFGGYRLPTRIAVGSHFGSPEYFAFLKAEVNSIEFPKRQTCDRPRQSMICASAQKPSVLSDTDAMQRSGTSPEHG